MFLTFVLTTRLSLTYGCICIAQVDSKLTSFVTALSEVASSEISSVTDPTYGPDSSGVGQSEISSVTDPTYDSDSGRMPGAGVGMGESAGALSSPDAVDAPTSVTDHANSTSSSWRRRFNPKSHQSEISSLTDPTYGSAPTLNKAAKTIKSYG